MVRRIESQTSRTAEFTCTARCLSYLEKRPQYHSDDNLALVIMNSLVKLLLRIPLARHALLSSFPVGMYEYVIARTKYIDEAVQSALRGGVDQVLILGAGFDTRGIRFQKMAGSTKVFELDAPVTQQAKIRRYIQKKIAAPHNLLFIPVDFDTQRIPDRLSECGFERNRKCLVVMEGLTMYLQPASAAELFSVIRDFTGTGSRVVFDFIHASVLRQENRYDGEKHLTKNTAKSGERFCFGLEKDAVPGFLSEYGLDAEDIADSAELEQRFFRSLDGKPDATVNGTHCIVTAIKK